MGRSSAGGSSGGGRSSGGGSSGGRSFGGGSGGSSGRSSSSYSSSSRSSYGSFRTSSSHRSYSPPPPPPPRHSYRPVHTHTTVYNNYGGSYNRGYNSTSRNNGSSSSGIGYAPFFVIWAVMFIFATVALILMRANTTSYVREKLANNLVSTTDYVIDDANWGVNNSRTKKGMQVFYAKTGVQPVIILAEEINGNVYPSDAEVENYMTGIYESVIHDEGHALFLYLDHGNATFNVYWLVGSDAKTVVDDEVCNKLLDYFDRYASSDMDDETYISQSFENTAKFAMGSPARVYVFTGIFYSVLGVLFIIIVIFAVKDKRKEQRIREMEQAERILNTDI